MFYNVALSVDKSIFLYYKAISRFRTQKLNLRLQHKSFTKRIFFFVIFIFVKSGHTSIWTLVYFDYVMDTLQQFYIWTLAKISFKVYVPCHLHQHYYNILNLFTLLFHVEKNVCCPGTYIYTLWSQTNLLEFNPQ